MSNDQASCAVKISKLTKSYKNGTIQALDQVSLSIARGETFGLIGPNGAGKTTLIGCILALLTPDSGKVEIFGKPADHLSVLEKTGYMPERVMFEHWMSGRQFLEFHHGLSRQPEETRDEDISKALERVELDRKVWDRRLKTYSRGMLQRLNIAQVLIGKPDMVLLDEPTLGLDPKGVALVREIVNEMKSSGTTAVINSHHLEEIERLCDRVAFIQNGKINSIECVNERSSKNYILHVSWSTTSLNGTLASALNNALSRTSCQLEEYNHTSGRFIVSDKTSASALLRELFIEGIPVDEAIAERKNLETLFDNWKEAV